MRYVGLGQNGAATEQESRIGPASVSVKEIPYDYVANFALTGIFGHRVQDVITVSAEGSFVAVSVGYSFVAPQVPVPVVSGALGGKLKVNGTDINSAGLPLDLFLAVMTPTGKPSAELIQSLVQQAITRRDIDFRYSIVDSGSGRELQNVAIHNIAGLGNASGDRPFRLLAHPALFLPRSTIRIEVVEISSGPLFAGGTIQIVLHGYKRLGG